MSITAENELTIRRAIAAKVATTTDVGYVLPCPIVFEDKADFWATVNGAAVNTKKLLDQTGIAFCAISLLKRIDSPKENCPDNPFVRLLYNFYFFRSLDATRQDETEIPDIFLRQTLLSYNTFIWAVLDVWNDFIGIQAVADLPDGIQGNTNSLVMPDFINEHDQCRYIPNLYGHAVNLQGVIEVLIYED